MNEFLRTSIGYNGGLFAGAIMEVGHIGDEIHRSRNYSPLLTDAVTTTLALGVNYMISPENLSLAHSVQNIVLASQIGLNLGAAVRLLFGGESLTSSPLLGTMIVGALGLGADWATKGTELQRVLNPTLVYKSIAPFVKGMLIPAANYLSSLRQK